MIDIVRDYAAISAGTAQATSAHALAAGRAGAGAALTWSASTVVEIEQDPRAALGQGSASVVMFVHGGLDRAASWMNLAQAGPFLVLRRTMPRLTWPHFWFGGAT